MLNFLSSLAKIKTIAMIEQFFINTDVDEYDSSSWRLFIDNLKHSLKCVLLHNTNMYHSIPIGHLATLKQKHEPIK